MAGSQSSPALMLEAAHIPAPHLHLADEVCPLCDQAIPRDRFDEIKDRIETRQRERSAEITSRLETQFAQDKAKALEQARQEADEKVDAARDEGRMAAEAAAREQLAAVAHAHEDAQAALRNELLEAATAKEEAERTLQAQIAEIRRQADADVTQAKEDAKAKEVEIRVDAARTAEAAVEDRIAGLESARQQSEATLLARVEQADAAKLAAEETGSALQARLDQLQRDNEATLAKIREDAVAREAEIRREATSTAEGAMAEKLAVVEKVRTEAEAKAAAAEEQLETLQRTQEGLFAERLKEQRDALEQAKTDAVNAEKSAAFEEKLKLSTKLEELQRAFDKKTAEELGEGAEIDLVEALKAEFEGDRIEKVGKGLPGADILHTVLHNGKECGSIIYDSKNHNAWRNDFVTKLAIDQMAAKADHAILSTRKFPAGARHLHIQEGVILASPARVVALVQLVRQHVVQTHSLRLSNEARTQKTAALYSYITSERSKDLFKRIDSQAEKLLDMQDKEEKTHRDMWKRRGEVLKSIQKVNAEVRNEIDLIIGTADDTETGS